MLPCHDLLLETHCKPVDLIAWCQGECTLYNVTATSSCNTIGFREEFMSIF